MSTIWTQAGQPAFDELADTLAWLRGADALRSITVVTPTPAAAVELRRALARTSGGLVAVSFLSLESLAEQLAAPWSGTDGPTGAGEHEVLVAAVRAELADWPGHFRHIAHHRTTWETLAGTVTELAGLTAGERSAVAETGGQLAAEAVRLHDVLSARPGVGLGASGRVAVLRAAASRVEADPVALDACGPVVAFLPGRLDAPAAGLLRVIGRRGDATIISARSGVSSVDLAVTESVVRAGGEAPVGDAPAPALPSSVISANDVDDEVRAAVRYLLARAEAGVPLHTMALVHPPGPPYARTVAELLRAAGVPHAGPSTETLAQTSAGRVLRALLDVEATGFSRESVVDLWSSGLVVDASGRPVASVALDRRTRHLGVVGRLDDFRSRIEARRSWLVDHPVEEVADDPDRTARRHRRRATELDELTAVDELLTTAATLIDSRPASWAGLGAWAGQVLDALCGPPTRRSDWPTHELDADTAIRTVLGRLAGVAAVDPEPAPRVLVETIRATLDTPAPRRSGTGNGLLVTTIDRPPVVPRTVVAVVGLVEGHVPRLAREDVVLSDAARGAGGLPVADDHTVLQQAGLQWALASADDRILTYARCDQRSGRTQVPSRWLVDAIEGLTGARPRTAALIAGAPLPGVEVVESHAETLRRAVGVTAIHDDERRLAALSGAADFDAHPAVFDPVVAAGALLDRSRAADAFTRFDGNLDGAGIDVLGGGRHLSPTGIEAYATCPRKWFFGHGLGIGDVDRPEEVDRLQASDKGTLAHRILERFVGEAVDADTVPAPGSSWGPDGEARLLEIAEVELADFERRGLTGHPRWWAYDRAEILDVLRTTLRHDDEVRARSGATPVAVELSFGRDGTPPLEVTLADGRVVPLAGQADRVDVGPAGVQVFDYKYASSSAYRGLDAPVDGDDPAAGGDPLDGGQRIQLVTYAAAAAAQYGIDRSSAWYWFLKPGHTGTLIGYEIGPHHRHLLRETLRTVVDGVAEGRFPAHAGSEDWWAGTNQRCRYCPFDSVCPADREEEWERVRADPSLVDIVRLAEEGTVTFLSASQTDSPAGHATEEAVT